ncbi:MAG: type I DNA topoisomerase [Muribaculaceae bacterium]|nr:type I DNA topoisomerase [Muribaculaceae bacterium]
MSTPRNLVIVESPHKAKTIEKFLGPDYKVMSSAGHIRDLKKHSFSIDVEKDFAPVYVIPDDKTQLVSELKKAARQADMVWLASDEDREGEAIAWHLYEVLGLKPEKTRRIVFHEITKNAILHAIANPRGIDLGRVDAQQARRVLDRIVGFELSPVLWKRLKPSLSAGRVQSVAVRLIVERELEIRNFVSEPYYRVFGYFTAAEGPAFKAELSKRFATAAEAHEFLESCAGANFTIGEITVKPMRKSPAPPFTTSTLQQEAARKLGFSVSQTMMIAQKLYENGHITYMRTDSVNLSQEAVADMSREITEKLGERYLHVRQFHTSSKGAQEAHEAIRPTYISRETLDEGTDREKKLYSLIRKRALASQMADAEVEKTTVEIAVSGRPEQFTATGEVLKFDGFLRMYLESHEDEVLDETGADGRLPILRHGEALNYRDITAIERFTQHPPRYTEASLVKKMEELGIGRPSTYAPTISTIQQREYVVRGEKEGTPRDFETMTLADGKITEAVRTENTGSDRGKLVPTDIGMIVNDFLTEYFPDILDYNFTARIEERFDDIAEGKLPWSEEIAQFYKLFHPAVEGALSHKTGPKFGERILGTDPETGHPVSVKIGRFGPVVQIGETESDEKPRFASLRKDQSIQDITLEEALKLFEFPRTLGTFEDKDVTVAIGRFGPYVRHDGKFASIPADIAPGELTLDEAVRLIEDKRREEASRVLKSFDQEGTTQILNGRYGPYIVHDKKNYKIPKSITTPAELTLEQVMEIVKASDEAPAKPRRASSRRKK